MGAYLPILILLAIVVLATVAMLALARRLAPRDPGAVKRLSYEAGEEPLGRARVRLTVPFFRAGILFVGVEIGAILVLVWAVVYRDLLKSDTGGPVLAGMLVFLGLVLMGYVYAVRKGALDWD